MKKIHDKVWGDSEAGPVEAGEDVVDGGAHDRDPRQDPWGGRSVHDVSKLPSALPHREVTSDLENPLDEESGGNAGIVGKDPRLNDRGM